MEFRLTYRGPLLSETGRDGEVRRGRADHKKEIRKKLHPQLGRVVNCHGSRQANLHSE